MSVSTLKHIMSAPKGFLEREPESILKIRWKNRKYIKGAELSVLIEKVYLENDDIFLIVIEKSDHERRQRMEMRLSDLDKGNKIFDFTAATEEVLTNTNGRSLFTTKLDENVEIICRAMVPDWETDRNFFDRNKVRVYLLDYAKYQLAQIPKLNQIVKKRYYRPPPMAMKVKLFGDVDGAQNLRQLQLRLSGQSKKIRVIDVRTIMDGKAQETLIHAEFIQ